MRYASFLLLAFFLLAACSDDTTREPCEDGLIECAGVCIDPRTSAEHCGDCDNDCGANAECVNGFCQCLTGFTACSSACTDTDSDPANCGACENACGADQVCTNGNCACFGSMQECGSACVDTQTDPDHCGQCDNVCVITAGEMCVSGVCQVDGCTDPYIICGASCVDPNTSNQHCGVCDNACDMGNGFTCQSGSCACFVGQECVAGVCSDTNTDPLHCGQCNNPCTGGQVCSNGSCSASCAGGLTDCSGSCVDTNTDINHCGGCDQACDATEQCISGSCTCPDGDSDGYDVCNPTASHDNDGNLPDCDDSEAAVNPGEFEGPMGDASCQDGLDNDCDTLTDLTDPACCGCLLDSDCDDGNICTTNQCVTCTCLSNPVADGTVCDDMDACTMGEACTAGACGGGVATDVDGDGFGPIACGGTDCNDNEAREAPGFKEICGNALDEDCSGSPDDLDEDGDTYVSDLPACGGDDCDDQDPAVYTGQTEDCANTIDDDCDLDVDCADSDCINVCGANCADNDGDGFAGYNDPNCLNGTDLDDTDRFIYPGAVELCDLKDNNQDGTTDEWIISTLAGDGTDGWLDDYPATTPSAAKFSKPVGLTIDDAASLYLTESFTTGLNHDVRWIDALTGGVVTAAGTPGQSGRQDGFRDITAPFAAGAAAFNNPSAVSWTPGYPGGGQNLRGGLLVADRNNHRIMYVDLLQFDVTANPMPADSDPNFVTVFAGTGSPGSVNGDRLTTAQLGMVSGIVQDLNGDVIIADSRLNCLRKIDMQTDLVSDFAGVCDWNGTTAGYQDGLGANARFRGPGDLALDGAGNIVVVDGGNHCIRQVDPSGDVTTLAGVCLDYPGGKPTCPAPSDSCDGETTDTNGNPADDAEFVGPVAVAVDLRTGWIYVSEVMNLRLRVIHPDPANPGQYFWVSTIAGNGTAAPPTGPSAPACTEPIGDPIGVAVDANGIVYLSDSDNRLIRKITP